MRVYGFLLTLFTSFTFLVMPVHAGSNKHFAELNDLQALGIESKQTELPIMLMFGAEWCEYCELLVEQVLEPMAYGGLYEDKMLMRHVAIDDDEPIKGFNGQLIKKANFAYQRDADLTPTVLFLDGYGNEVGPRIVGIQEVTLFTNVIHRSLIIAYKTMGSKTEIPVTVELLEQQVRDRKLNQALPALPKTN
jgi:thioredoxin-related protein